MIAISYPKIEDNVEVHGKRAVIFLIVTVRKFIEVFSCRYYAKNRSLVDTLRVRGVAMSN